MTTFPRPVAGGTPVPDWDVRVLDLPAVVTLPDPAQPPLDPLVDAALDAVLAVAAQSPASHRPIGDLARAGVVAIQTSQGAFEIHETLLGWTLVLAAGSPDPGDLAEAARIRAQRLARLRRQPGTGKPSG
jgi:hypothetical protein